MSRTGLIWAGLFNDSQQGSDSALLLEIEEETPEYYVGRRRTLTGWGPLEQFPRDRWTRLSPDTPDNMRTPPPKKRDDAQQQDWLRQFIGRGTTP